MLFISQPAFAFRYWFLTFAAFSSLSLAAGEITTDNFYFDSTLLRDSGLSQHDLENLNQRDYIKPGRYPLDIFVNGTFITRDDITFNAAEKGSTACLNADLLSRLGLKALPENPQEKCYLPGGSLLKNTTIRYNISRLRADFTIPQEMLKANPRGSIDPQNLDSGESMLFINYLLNQYHVSARQGQESNIESTYVNLNGGVNIGRWRYRQASTLNYDKQSGRQWDTSRLYVQRGIMALKSELLLGEGYTDGRFFSGMGFRGIQLTSDTRMLPESQRGFAPTVRGIAKTNARVSVLQGTTVLYETTVAPGPFSINDLYPTNYSGDLTVVVTEADGSKNTFSIPFSALPESVRPGLFTYSATVGQTRDTDNKDTFAEVVWQQGVTNSLTANAGAEIASGYQGLMLGSVYNSPVGAFGVDGIWSRARLTDANYDTGWMFRLNYSKYFSSSGTSIALAGYRYSTRGFISLSDTLGVREAARQNYAWQSTTFRQRTRLEASASQTLGNLGLINISASSQDYRDSKGRDNQLQMSWNKAFSNGVSLSLSVARTRTIQKESRYDLSTETDYALLTDRQTLMSLSLSVPLGTHRNSPTLQFNANHTNNGPDNGGYQASLTGSYGETDPISYSLNTATNEQGRNAVWGATLQKNLPWGGASASFSSSQNYWQASGAFQGSVVGHRSGITFGPWVGDTFALIEAPGASGAKIQGGMGSRVNMFGYAVMPTLMPYQYNAVALDPEGINSKTELQVSQQRVAPWAGASVRLKFSTIRGQALLITVSNIGVYGIPIGTGVYDKLDNYIGMVGQGNQIYLRAEGEKGELKLAWGAGKSERCRLKYHITPSEDPIQLLSLPCLAG